MGLFDKFNNKKPGSNTDTKCAEDALAKTEKALDIRSRTLAVQNQLQEIAASQPVNLDNILNMIGSLGTDNAIDQSIIDGLASVLGNDPDPIKMTQYFSGIIAKRILTVADVRKIPGALFAQKGGTPLDITSSLVYTQPMHLFGSTSLIQPARFAQSPYSVAFNENSLITIGSDTFNNYLTNTSGSYASPFVGHLWVIKRNDTLRGDAKFLIESEYGYKAGIQLTDDTAIVVMLNHHKALKVESSITQDVAAPPNLGVNLVFEESDLDEQFEVSTVGPMEVTVQGTNVSITHYQLPMYTPIAEAILASLISGRMDMLPTWIMNNLSKQFKFN